MKKWKYLHLGAANNFTATHLELVESHFIPSEHRFYLFDSIATENFTEKENVTVFKPCGFSALHYLAIVAYAIRSKKIILHGLTDIYVIAILRIFPSLLKKCYWIIWGADLYYFAHSGSPWKQVVTANLRRYVIKRIGQLVTYISGDVEFARREYGAQGAHLECLMYISNVADHQSFSTPPAQNQHQAAMTILVGNSADPSNNHREAFGKLLPFKNFNIEIYAPLSYGDKTYAREIAQLGRDWFGEKFHPVTTLLTLDEYLNLLRRVDLAVFNHKRQQAMGNTISLLGLGKTVYIRSDVSQWRLFKSKGIMVLNIDDFDLSTLAKEDKDRNVSLIKSNFNYQSLVDQYKNIYKS